MKKAKNNLLGLSILSTGHGTLFLPNGNFFFVEKAPNYVVFPISKDSKIFALINSTLHRDLMSMQAYA